MISQDPRFKVFQRQIIPGLVLATVLVSCGRPAKLPVSQAASPPENKLFSDPVPRAPEADDVGRFLGGLPGREGSAFHDLESQEAWQGHRRELDRAWKRLEAEQLPGMREFQSKELNSPAVERSVAFYPFSGPDVLMLTTLFPNNPVYVMVALEPVGTLPTPKQFGKKDLRVALGQERETVESELVRSFFITRQMDRQFRGQVTDGLLAPILHLLVRTNHTILGFRYVRLDEKGELVDRPAAWTTTGKIANRGVEIDFQKDSDKKIQKLFYFSVNLANDHLQDNQPFMTFVSKLKGATSYFKATSYMTHKPEFSMIRDGVLTNSAAVLQDDSGIPYHYFATQPWQVQLFGEYDRPYGSFRWLEQKDLKQAYASNGPKPLGFKIGYGYSRIPSNLLFARKADATASQ